MTLQAFINLYNGQSGVGDNPQNDGECTGLVAKWTDSLGLPHIYGNACDMPSQIDHNAYAIGSGPLAGDIVCFPAGWGNSAVGHTAIVVSGNEVLEQNDRIGGGDGRVRLYNLAYPAGTVFIHIKALSNQASNQGEEMISDEAHVQALFQAFRGRSAGPAEVKQFVGSPYAGLVEALNAGPERAATIAALARGKAPAPAPAAAVVLKPGTYTVQ